MAFYGRANRIFLESDLREGTVFDSQITECDLDGLRAVGCHWENTDMTDLNASGATFTGCSFASSTFERVNMQATSFTGCAFSGMTFSGLTLIKSFWADVTLARSAIRHCSLQRASFSRLRAHRSSFTDFEALNARIDRSSFLGCSFEISYGIGMNGFSGAEITNAIFCDCKFSGFPLRGAHLENCAFIRCRGDISDEIECVNVSGLPRIATAKPRKIGNLTAARGMLLQYGYGEDM